MAGRRVLKGGPGASGKTWVTQLGASFQAFLSENYDIVGFDPRGIGLTEYISTETSSLPSELLSRPGVHCLRPQDNVLFGINSILQTGFDVAPNISDPETRNHLIIQQREVNALYKTIMEVCKASLGNTIRYMGSSTIARDVDFITTVLEGDSALMYVRNPEEFYFLIISIEIIGESVMAQSLGVTLSICACNVLPVFKVY